jgi:hypothetical protein
MCDRDLRDAMRAAGRALRGLDRLPAFAVDWRLVANLAARFFSARGFNCR